MNTNCYAVTDTNLKKIIAHYGKDSQRMKALEELNELAVAIAHKDRTSIQEEMADVWVMLLQLMLIYNISETNIFAAMDYKIQRTLNRIGEENEIQSH